MRGIRKGTAELQVYTYHGDPEAFDSMAVRCHWVPVTVLVVGGVSPNSRHTILRENGEVAIVRGEDLRQYPPR